IGLGSRRRVRVATTVWGTLAVNYAVKRAVRRERPLVAGLVPAPSSHSFPSSHAAMSTAAAVVLSAAHPRMAPAGATMAAAIAGAAVRHPRLEAPSQVSSSARIVPATLEGVDIAGLVRGASHGEGLGNQFLRNIRTTDAVLHVVRCFHDDTVAHPAGRIDPLDDAETVELELAFADLAAIERRVERVAKAAKSGDRGAAAERDALEE